MKPGIPLPHVVVSGVSEHTVNMFHTYILANKRNGTLYIGSTDDLLKRVWEHREKVRAGFTAKYGLSVLVWHEAHDTREGAFRRERRIKEWRRSWKLLLIEERNPTWRDLYDELLGPGLQAAEWLEALDSNGGSTSAALSGDRE